MKTFIFIRNKTFRPSSYYRIYQYLEHLVIPEVRVCEFETNNYYKKTSKNRIFKSLLLFMYSMFPGYIRRILLLIEISNEKKSCYNLYVQRECFPKIIGPLGRRLLQRAVINAKSVYWDFDDNIFEVKEITTFETRLLKQYSEKIFVGNEYLKKKLTDCNVNKIEIINTTDKMMEEVNLELINPNRLKYYDSQIVLIWIGTKRNIQHLRKVIKELDDAAKKLKNKELILKVVSDGILDYNADQLKIINIKWERDIAFKEMLGAHIGLMPLEEKEFTKGKCAFKAIQSIGCGLPVIVSDVGMNRDVVEYGNGFLVKDSEEWITSIIELSSDKDLWLKKSILSRELWKQRFNSRTVQELLLGLFGKGVVKDR